MMLFPLASAYKVVINHKIIHVLVKIAAAVIA
jgi:hypothetical protein